MASSNRYTIVTSYYYIGRDKWEFFSLPTEAYLAWMKNLLALNTQLYVVVDEENVDYVVEHRRPYDPDLSKTRIQPMKVEDTPAYNRYHDSLAALMSSEDFKKKVHFEVPEMLYPMYNILMFNKPFLLEQAAAENPFGSRYFGWVDAGALRGDSDQYRSGSPWPNPANAFPRDKIRVFSHHKTIELSDLEEHALSQMRYIQGTALFVGDQCIAAFRQMVDKWIRHCLSSGYIGSDEKMFDFCWYHDRDRFDVVKADWREFFQIMA